MFEHGANKGYRDREKQQKSPVKLLFVPNCFRYSKSKLDKPTNTC